METVDLTKKQQAVAALDSEFCDMQVRLEWMLQLSIDISEFFGMSNLKTYLVDASLSSSERLMKVSKIIWDYDTYRIYVEILEHLILELKEMVDQMH